MALQMAGDLSPTQVVYVGDNYYADVVGALNVGMDAILVDPHDIFRTEYTRRRENAQRGAGSDRAGVKPCLTKISPLGPKCHNLQR